MLSNRSMPRCTVIPELAYADIGEAIDWLCDAFGFTLRLRIADHRAQLNVGDGAVVLTNLEASEPRAELAHAVMVRVEDVDGHHERDAHVARESCGRQRTIHTASGSTRSWIPAATAGRFLSRSGTSILRTGAARQASCRSDSPVTEV